MDSTNKSDTIDLSSLEFALKIVNTSKHTVNIPKAYRTTANKNIYFAENVNVDAIYLGTETSFTRGSCCFLNAGNQRPESRTLEADSAFSFISSIRCFTFDRKGVYKIRFSLDPFKTGLYGNTGWLCLLWNPEFRSATFCEINATDNPKEYQ